MFVRQRIVDAESLPYRFVYESGELSAASLFMREREQRGNFRLLASQLGPHREKNHNHDNIIFYIQCITASLFYQDLFNSRTKFE